MSFMFNLNRAYRAQELNDGILNHKVALAGISYVTRNSNELTV